MKLPFAVFYVPGALADYSYAVSHHWSLETADRALERWVGKPSPRDAFYTMPRAHLEVCERGADGV